MLTAIVIFFLSVLSGLGVGSAGLLVTWLTVAMHAPHLTAQSINLIYFIFSAGAALLLHAFRSPPLWKCILFLLPMGILGSLLGARLALWLPEALLRRIFGYMLITTGTLGLFKR